MARKTLKESLADLHQIHPKRTDMTQTFLSNHVLDQVQESKDYQDFVMREESKKVPPWKWGKSTRKVTPSGMLRKRRRTRSNR